jgi:hypothetical protein
MNIFSSNTYECKEKTDLMYPKNSNSGGKVKSSVCKARKSLGMKRTFVRCNDER